MAERPFDLTVRNAVVVSGDGRGRFDVGVRGGIIVALEPAGTLAPGVRDLDAGGLLLLPGIVDTHFHCRAPDHPEREDVDSGTAAAAAGGVTTIVEMPIADVSCSTPERLEARMALAAQQARVDIGFHAAVGDLDRPRVQEMADAGAVAFKVMMHSAPPGREPSFAGLAITDDRDLYRALEAVATTDRVLMVHAEHQALIDLLEAREQAAGRNGPDAHVRSRPDVAESSAIARIASMNEQVGARLHIVHLSSERGLDQVRFYRSRGQRITCETTPAYLYADGDDVERYGPFVKINPPLRTPVDRAALFAGLHADDVDMVVSDHAPFLAHEKEAGWTDIWAVGSGIPGVELTGPLLWDDALRGGLSLEQVVRWTSERPADVFGLAPRKGRIAIGADADFLLLDPNAETELGADHFHSRSRGALRHVLGRRCRGALRAVWSRGRQVARDGTVVAEPGSGHVLRSVATEGQTPDGHASDVPPPTPFAPPG